MPSLPKIFFTVALFFSVQELNAQKKGFGPHGGRLKTVGDYQIELFGCNDYIEIYLFDSDTNAISNGNINGTVAFYYNQQSTLVGALMRYGMDGFTTKIPITTFLYCKPNLDIEGRFIVTERFENECLNSKN